MRLWIEHTTSVGFFSWRSAEGELLTMEDAMAENSSPLKVYFIPFIAPGHMIPLVEMARLFAARGEYVTVIASQKNAQLVQKSIDKDRESCRRLIDIHTITFPAKEVGLPDGFETFSDVKDLKTAEKLYKGVVLMRQQIEKFMVSNPPDCIVADMFFDWTSEFAKNFGIPRLFFNGQSVFAMCMMECLRGPDAPHLQLSSDSEPFQFPGLPNRISLTRSRLPDHVLSTNDHTLLLEVIRESQKNSYGVIVNSFAELETEYIQHYKNIMGHMVWHIGPTLLIHGNDEEKADRSHTTAVSDHECLNWLNSKEANSVLYVCFGSACRFPNEQLYEIASGLVSSGHQFIWVVLGNDSKSESEQDQWLPKEFEERTKNKGMIIRGWAPQLLILDHPAIGGFLTHCGWNSLIESTAAGVPVLTWPLMSEQHFNEALVTQVLGTGLEVGVEEFTNFVSDDCKWKIVDREKVEKAVKRLMDGGQEGQEVRRRAHELRNKAKEAVNEGGSSHQNLTALIEDLKRLRANKV